MRHPPVVLVSAVALALSLVAGCGAQRTAEPRVVSRDGIMPAVAWSDAERAKPVAAKLLRTTDQASTFLILLNQAESPHTHDTHDVMVVMVSGGGILHIGDRAEPVRPGDIMEIPRGVVHWAENTAPGGSVVYAVFTPPYDGSDMHPVGSRQF
ncbi:MAG: cupin domain-containing protein [Planctomycetes bacterium]|nr:cupin domain-containing protein [Planctomycetota bacterium]